MLGTVLMTIIFIIVMIAINAFYVAGEFASVSARKTRIAQAADEGNRLAKMLLPIIDDTHKLDSYIAASQVGITLSSIALGIFGQQQIAPLIAPALAQLPFISSEVAAAGIAVILVLIVLTTLQVILGELVPKSIAIQYPERIALMTTLPMRWSAEIILRPLIILLNGSGLILLKLLGVRNHAGHGRVHSPEEIELLIAQSHEGGLLDSEERELLGNAFRVGELTVGDVVIPRTKMLAVSVDSSLPDLLRLAVDSHYTRLPVYEDDIDHITGFVHLKDLFRLYRDNGDPNIRKCLRKVSFVPETMSTNDVWDTFNRERTYIAIVFDEYGGTVGMVTREDVIELLFGEVQDEFEEDEEQPIKQIGEREYRVQGDVSVAYLNNYLDLELSSEHAYTISGLIIAHLERMPAVGDEVNLEGVHFQIESVDKRKVNHLLLRLIDKNEEN